LRSVFFSHAGADTDASRTLVRRLEAAGFDVWFDKNDLKPGREGWQRRLYDAIKSVDAFVVYVGARGIVNWVEAEVNEAVSRAITRQADDPFVFVPILSRASPGYRALPGFARQFQAVSDVENELEQWNALIHALANGNPPIPEKNPFFGLKAIDESRSHLFFGRARETRDIAKRLAERGVLLVTGASGSGKSSLLKAGLVPAWHGNQIGELRGYRPEDRVWHTIITRPGKDPFGTLYHDLTKVARSVGLSPIEVEELGKLGRDGDLDARKRALRCGLDHASASVLLIVDQFEELWGPTVSEADREEYLNLLTELVDPDDLSFAVALSMRDDYAARLTLPEASSLAALLDAQNRCARFPLRAIGFLDRDDAGAGDDMTPRNALSDIVTKPLALARWKADNQKLQERTEAEALARMVIADATDRPGDLALVQCALTRAWDTRGEHDNNLQTAYVAAGRIEGALAQSAEQAFAALKRTGVAEDQIEAAMVRLGSLAGAGPLRRVAPHSEFSEAGWKALQFLASPAGFRLVLIEGEEDDARAEIAHEALLTQWARLNNWLSRYAEDVRLLHGLAGRVLEMRGDLVAAEIAPMRLGIPQRLGLTPPNPGGPVLAELDLKRFEPLHKQHPMWLAVAETDLLTRSGSDVAARKLSEIRVKQYMGGLLVALTVAFVGAGFATFSSQAAERRASANAAAAMAGLSELAITHRKDRQGAILALSSLASFPSSSPPPRIVAVFDNASAVSFKDPQHGHEAWVSSVAFSPDGSRIVSGSDDLTLRLWDAATGAALGEPLRGHDEHVSSVAFSPDGTRIVSGSRDATLRLWDAATGAALGEPLRGHDEHVSSVAFSPDGSRIVSGSDDLTLRLWDAATGAALGEPLRGHDEHVSSVAFSPDGTRIVSGSDDGTLRLWNAATGTALGEPMRGHQGRVNSVAFSPDGSRIVSGGDDGTLRLWDAATGEPLGEPLRESEDWVGSVAFSPDGSSVLSGGSWGILRLWDATTGATLGAPLRPTDGAPVHSVAFSFDGGRIASGGGGGTLRRLEVARHYGPSRIALLCDALQPITRDEIAAIESDTGLSLPAICTPEQRSRQLPAIWVPGPPITPPAFEVTSP